MFVDKAPLKVKDNTAEEKANTRYYKEQQSKTGHFHNTKERQHTIVMEDEGESNMMSIHRAKLWICVSAQYVLTAPGMLGAAPIMQEHVPTTA